MGVMSCYYSVLPDVLVMAKLLPSVTPQHEEMFLYYTDGLTNLALWSRSLTDFSILCADKGDNL